MVEADDLARAADQRRAELFKAMIGIGVLARLLRCRQKCLTGETRETAGSVFSGDSESRDGPCEVIHASKVYAAPWVRMKCQFGCRSYAQAILRH